MRLFEELAAQERPHRRQSSRSSARASTTTTCRRSSTLVLSRGEFLTAYTPYQPEMSQGVLQAIFEYQTAICELTGMDVSNASGYDGCTVAADACFIAQARDRPLEGGASPRPSTRMVRQVVKTYAPGFGLEVVEVPHTDGTTDPDAAGRRVVRTRRQCSSSSRTSSACLEDAPALAAAADGRGRARGRARRPDLARRARGARSVRLRDRDRRGPGRRQRPELRRPSLRLSRLAAWSSSGPLAGRIVGQTTDLDGEIAASSSRSRPREQHIRREKATSNMTTNQTLLALGGLLHARLARPAGAPSCWGLPSSCPSPPMPPGGRSLAAHPTAFQTGPCSRSSPCARLAPDSA